MRIGVISDTHGRVPAEVHSAFRDVDHILHAGDVGPMEIIWELESLAPVSAVCGNTDYETGLPETRVDEFAGKKFLLHHIVDFPEPIGAVAKRIADENPDAVVFGHTHVFCHKKRSGILWLNPGSACQPRGEHPASVVIVEIAGGIEIQVVPLPPG